MTNRVVVALVASVMSTLACIVLVPDAPVAAAPGGTFVRQVADPVDEGAPTEQFGTVGPRITPGVNEIQVVGLETWLAIDPASYKEISWSTGDVDYRAEPRATIWDFTDLTVRCEGPGTEYTPGAAGPAPCGREWDQTTSVGPMAMTVRVEYEVFWYYEEAVEPPPAPEPPPPPEPEYDEDGNLIPPPSTTLPPPPPPPPPVAHSGSYTDHSAPGTWDLQVGEIQTNGVDEDAPTPQYDDGSSDDDQSIDRIPGTSEGDENPIDSIDCGSRWNAVYYGVCTGFKWAIKRIPGIETVFSLAEGCFENVTDFVGAITNLGQEALAALENPIQYFKDKIAQFNALIEAIRLDPVAFAQEFLGDTFEVDLLREDPAKWIGKVGCQVALAVLTGGGQLAAKLLKSTDDILAWINRQKRDGDDNDNDNDNDVSTCGVNSFPTGTSVLMADGTRRPIESVRPGDLVSAANTATGQWSPRRVLDQWSYLDDGRMATVTLSDGSSVTATDHHEFWVADDGEWRELDEVRPGDFLLTPDGVSEVDSLHVTGIRDTLVWELDVAVDDTFAVHTGTQDVLVHNADCAPGDLTAADLMDPDFRVPGTTEFNRWFDELDPDAFREAFENDPDFRDAIKDRIRYPGGRHEWCMCSEVPTIKDWGVSMEEIRDFTTATRDTTWVNPNTGVAGNHVAPGIPAVDSNNFHTALREVINSSENVADFNRNIQQFWDDWQVPVSSRPTNFPTGRN
ncbi:MAG: Hint domain-containing protein [Ilumatobacter sp.]|uniref:Hint domain-containing protein n=1 Tax=Ilumatobacter sp. TaxID=1967498 RepID=UPI0032987399